MTKPKQGIGHAEGWWDNLWFTYDNKRFKQTFRITRSTFELMLARIRPHLERKTLTEEPISPEFRLAICLYRLGRGDNLYSKAVQTGIPQMMLIYLVGFIHFLN